MSQSKVIICDKCSHKQDTVDVGIDTADDWKQITLSVTGNKVRKHIDLCPNCCTEIFGKLDLRDVPVNDIGNQLISLISDIVYDEIENQQG